MRRTLLVLLLLTGFAWGQELDLDEKIDAVRKMDLTVKVEDTQGHPIPACQVVATQTRHAFLFGGWLTEPSARFAAVFNAATVPLRGESFEARVEWCLREHIAPRGHALLEADAPDPHAHVSRTVKRYIGRVDSWVVAPEGTPAKAVASALDWARHAAGIESEKLLCESSHVDATYETLLDALAKTNHLPDGIGLEAIMLTGTWSLERIADVCERFRRYARPLHLTLAVLSGAPRPAGGPEPRPWSSTAAGEEAQADAVEQLYTTLFSNPAVESITWRDMRDGTAPTGLLRRDGTPKPAYERLLSLIRHKWWSQVSGFGDAGGVFNARVFYGDYTVSATGPNGWHRVRTFHFDAGSGPHTIVIVLR